MRLLALQHVAVCLGMKCGLFSALPDRAQALCSPWASHGPSKQVMHHPPLLTPGTV